MDEFGRELLITLIGVLAAKALDETIEALKKKASEKAGKHARRR